MSLDIPTASDPVACPVCGNSEGLVVGSQGRFGMPVRNLCCAKCATVYVTPRPSAAAMAEYYRATYREHYGGLGYFLKNGQRVAPGEQGFEEAMADWHGSQAQNAVRLGQTPANARVLEIGCRHGKTLSLMQEMLKIEAFGIEPGEHEAREARKAGVQCFTGQLEDFHLEGGLFDQVQLFHVLEHVHEPLSALLKLRSLLKADGRLVIEVPNVYQPYGLLEENFFQNVHLVSYSPSTLPALLRRAGFDVLQVLDAASLFAVARPSRLPEAAVLPLPFAPELLDQAEHTAAWLAVRLGTYANLEKLKFLAGERGLTPELASSLVRSLQFPAFTGHLLETCAYFIEGLAGSGRLDDAVRVTLAVANGPHPEELRREFRVFAERMGAPPAPPATAATAATAEPSD